ncbi:transmembrane protein 254 [Hemicordylus capensis]|uniref:transmembrane protein 254 n=1 Tax=Hemicordylus capensis TaxID=884348 RepID=UPI0023025E44|nr:transmembrane protein 254 [Hemicordylus capensis]
MAAASAVSQSRSTYFRRSSSFWMVLIAAGMGLYTWAVISPSSFPYDLLGPVGTATKYVVENHNAYFRGGYWLAWLIHLGEALYALKLCKAKGITDSSTVLQWFVQTFLFGIASLSLLLTYNPQKKR